jgi:Trypsin-co-occurring domain 1
MTAQMVVELSGGHKLLLGGRGAAGGLGEVALGERAVTATADRFKAALGSLGALVTLLEEKVGEMAKRPDKVEMAFGASLTAECDLWIVSGTGEAEFKVTLTWGKD